MGVPVEAAHVDELFAVGDDVEALRQDGSWLPGKIEAILRGSKCMVAWDDSDPAEQRIRSKCQIRRPMGVAAPVAAQMSRQRSLAPFGLECNIATLGGPLCTVNLPAGSSLRDLEAAIQAQTGEAVLGQRLLRGGQELCSGDFARLADEGVAAVDLTLVRLAPALDLSDRKLCVSDFQLGATLGTGAVARVKFAMHTKTMENYALKIRKKAAVIQMNSVDHVVSERQILASCRHPFIVRLCGSFHDSRYIYMLLEFIVGGELIDILRKAVRFENSKSMFCASQITAAFEYCHSKNLVYRGLDLENVLMDAGGYLKLIGFGFAKVVEHRTYTMAAMGDYMMTVPEFILNKGHGKPADWWCLGIFIYELIVGYPPFVDEDPMGIYQKILSGKIAFPKLFDKDAKALVKKLLTADLGKRYGNLKNGVDDIKQHRWFKELDWSLLVARRLPAPFEPRIQGPTDTSMFSDRPDSDDQPPAVNLAQDPFASW